MKKLLYVLSLLVIASMILTACGGQPAATQAPAAKPEPTKAEPPKAAPKPEPLRAVPGVDDLSLEQLAINQTGGLFEETYGMKVLLRRVRR